MLIRRSGQTVFITAKSLVTVESDIATMIITNFGSLSGNALDGGTCAYKIIVDNGMIDFIDSVELC